MQDIMPPVGADAQLVQSYGSAGFRIGNRNYPTHVLVVPTLTVEWDGVLNLDAMKPILEAEPKPEILIFGTGSRHVMLSPALRTQLKSRGFNVDSMDTGAACRTFNVLLGEGRRVAAVLMLPTG